MPSPAKFGQDAGNIHLVADRARHDADALTGGYQDEQPIRIEHFAHLVGDRGDLIRQRFSFHRCQDHLLSLDDQRAAVSHQLLVDHTLLIG